MDSGGTSEAGGNPEAACRPTGLCPLHLIRLWGTGWGVGRPWLNFLWVDFCSVNSGALGNQADSEHCVSPGLQVRGPGQPGWWPVAVLTSSWGGLAWVSCPRVQGF